MLDLMMHSRTTHPHPTVKTKVYIVSGFLGAGKTSFIKELVKELPRASKILIIENDFGPVQLDVSPERAEGVSIHEFPSGCICCNIAGDFRRYLEATLKEGKVDYIIIEPSGIGRLSDVMATCLDVRISSHISLLSAITIVDAMRAPLYAHNFGDFFKDQIKHCHQVFISHNYDELKLKETLEMIRSYNELAPIFILPWDEGNLLYYVSLNSKQTIIDAIATLHATENHRTRHSERYHPEIPHHDHIAHHANDKSTSYTLDCNVPRSLENWHIRLKALIETDKKRVIDRIKGCLPLLNHKNAFVTYNGSTLELIPTTLNDTFITFTGSELLYDDLHYVINDTKLS